ncbi:MAG: protein kinase, partial [Bdellovibrionales bacterium]|nr:protein kinase [Bdellovibrionales bacterium]
KEALAMVSSRHKYVIRLDDFHSVGDLCYLSMEYAPDGDLRQYAESLGGKLSPTQCELFLLQAAEALDFIHKAGILHRDIKPDNLLVVDQQNIRLGDFGVAILPGEVSSLEELQRGVGTMSYMSPEVLSGAPYDRRSDIYALAVTMYEMLSGFHPFEGVPLAEQVNKRQNSNIPPLNSLVSSIPEHLASAIMKAMDYSPTKRYQSCREFIQGILQIKAKQLSEKAKARTTEAAPPSAKPQSQPAKPAPRPQEAVRAEPSRSEMSVSENAQQDGKSSRRSRRRKRKKKQNQEAQALTENTPISETREQRPEKKVGQVVDLEEAKRKKQISAPPKQEGRMQESEKPARERALEQGETRKEQQSTQGKAPQSEKTQPLQPQSAKQPQSDGARLADEMRKLVEGHMQAAPKRAAPPIGAARQNRPLPSKAHPQEAASPRDVTSEESSFPTEAKGNTQPEKEEVDIPIEKPKLARPFDAPQSEPVAESRRDSRKERAPKRADVSGEPSRLTQLPKKKKALSSRRHFLSQLTPPQMVLIAVASLFLLYVTS